MKIRPVILCGGAGTRLWPNSKNHQAKQFIDFGNWTLFGKTLERTKVSIFDTPIISTNKKYLKQVKQHLRKYKISKYKIVLEPAKRNTAPAILSTALIKDIPNEQPLMFFSADHLIEKISIFNKAINKYKSNLSNKNIFIFGIKPTSPSSEYGYFITKKIKGSINLVTKFIEKPNLLNAKKYLKSKKFLWNSGIFVWKNFDILSEFKKFQPKMFKILNDGYDLFNTKSEKDFINQNYSLLDEISIDFAIMEKTKNCYSIIADFDWSDLGTWTSLLNKSEKDENSNFTLKKNIYMEDVSGSLVYNKSDKLIVVNGLKDLIVVLDNDVLLIYPKGDDQKLKNIVKNVKKEFGDKM